jgi:hypothetical protein
VRPSREDDAADRLGATDGRAQGDEAAERVADPGRRLGVLGLHDREHGVGEGIEAARVVEAPGGAVAGQLGDDDPPLCGQPGRHEAPVRGEAAEAVDEDEGRPLAPNEVAEPRPGRGQVPFFESEQIQFGLRRHQGIFFP